MKHILLTVFLFFALAGTAYSDLELKVIKFKDNKVQFSVSNNTDEVILDEVVYCQFKQKGHDIEKRSRLISAVIPGDKETQSFYAPKKADSVSCWVQPLIPKSSGNTADLPKFNPPASWEQDDPAITGALMGVLGESFLAGWVVVTLVCLFVAFFAFFLPLFVWGIHNQTTKTAKEMEKLNRNFETFFANQRGGGVRQEPDGDALRAPASKRL